jgi:nitroreductase/NAD-dependent dihydropyrimidine dehydrogenase PreA subunit
VYPLIDDRCDGCGLCVAECGAHVLALADGVAAPRPGGACSACGHCVALCPRDAVRLPLAALPPAPAAALPSPEQVEALVAARRSVRSFRRAPVPRPLVERLLAAAARAPSGCNARPVGVVGVIDPFVLRAIERRTAAISGVLARLLRLPLVTAALRRAPLAALRRAGAPEVTDGLLSLGTDQAPTREWVTLGAPALLVFHARPDRPTPAEDCCIAADHVALLAPTLGLGTCWNGVVVEALRRDPWLRWRARIPRGARVYAVLAVGWPAVRFRRPAPRAPLPVRYV